MFVFAATQCESLLNFNISSIDWNCNTSVRNVSFNANSDVEFLLFEFLSYYSLNQINIIPNDNNIILDLTIVNNNLNANISVPFCPIFSKTLHHTLLLIEADCVKFIPNCANNRKYYDFVNADFESLNNFIFDFDWKIAFKVQDLNNIMYDNSL